MFRRFPVLVAVGALLFYLATLAHGVTLSSLNLTGAIAGWSLQPMISQPLLWVLTFPVRWLPAGWIAPALNLLSAVFAAATLGFMVASLELAAWDRPLAALGEWTARLPLLLGVVVCGLEFSYWQAATQATGEALQILLLAAALWCLFQYRAEQRRRWLRRAAFIWGLGMAENWMMMLTLPFFLAALVWLLKKNLLNLRLLAQLLLAGLAGGSLLVLLPIVNGLAPHSSLGVGAGLWEAGREIYRLFFNNYFRLWHTKPLVLGAVMVYFLLPLLPALIRQKDIGTQKQLKIDRLEVWLYRGLRMVLLALSLFLAFDPVFGLRQILWEKIGWRMPLLSFDYLLGLSVAYLAGNLLLALDLEAHAHRRRSGRKRFLRMLGKLTVPALAGVLGITLIGLLLRNAGAVTEVNRYPFLTFGESALQSLPAGGGVVLSDDPLRLMSFQAAAAAKGQDSVWLAVNTGRLQQPEYRFWLNRRHPGDWYLSSSENLRPDQMQTLLTWLSRSNPVYYLHPSFGYFFEKFYLQPAGIVQRVGQFTNLDIHPPPLTEAMISQTECTWDTLRTRLEAVTEANQPRRADAAYKLCNYLHLVPIQQSQDRLLGQWFSLALDNWGVQLQKAGRLAAAGQRFQQALALNTNNIAARINSQCNSNLLAGRKLRLSSLSALASSLPTLKDLGAFFLACGPVDEPSFCYLAGDAFRKTGLLRQAMQQLERSRAMDADPVAPQLALAELYARCGLEQQAREIINNLRANLPASQTTNSWLDASLSLLEAASWQQSSNVVAMQNALQAALEKYPNDARTASLAEQIYVSSGDYASALKLVERKLAEKPDDAGNRLKKAGLLARMGDTTNAVLEINRVLARTNWPAAGFLRGIVLLKAGQLAQSELDFQHLEKTAGYEIDSQLEMAEIAILRHDTNRALDHLTTALEHSPENSTKHLLISQRINQLRNQ
jgi:predicted Zn-dependent protease